MKVQTLTSLITSGTTGAAVTVGSSTDNGAGVVGLHIPTGFVGTTISFQGSLDGTTFLDIKKSDGTALSYTVAAATLVSIPAADLAGFPWIKPVSGSSETNKTVTFITRPVA